MKILFLTFTLFFSLSINAQNLTAIYKQNIEFPEMEKPTDEKNAKRYERRLHLLNETKILTNELEYKLMVNGNTSTFSLKRIMNKDGAHHLMSLANIYSKGVFYNDNSDKRRIWNVEAFGDNYIVNLPTLEWNIHNERKIIKGYTCNKAVTKRTSYSNGKKFEKDIIAWFTSEIPVSHGPVGYSGLPGLIVQLEIVDRVFTLEKIDNYVKKPTKEPKNGKKIDLKEYYVLFEKANNNFSSN
ncbi:GLPGLI family protein [Psychroflexus tropicus]|uniref:GLPGLI family protein n=1 Tax=Psychroflexus tropicus TaxID=197345 RepID=UPI000377D24A|nr:GLPGLI family protein [Psychroflexus tropicus]